MHLSAQEARPQPYFNWRANCLRPFLSLRPPTSAHGKSRSPIFTSSPVKQAVCELEFRGVTLLVVLLDDRITSVSKDVLYWLHAYAQKHNIALLIEADGSRQKALKTPNDHEPVIPEFTDAVVVVAGLSGLGKSLNDEYVHRSQLFSTLSGLPFNELITSNALVRASFIPMADLKIFHLTHVESFCSIKPIHQNCNPSAERCRLLCSSISIGCRRQFARIPFSNL